MTTLQTSSTAPVTATGCCPPFAPEPWDGKEVVWNNKPFVRDHVTCLFHIPLNMDRKMKKDMALIEAAHAKGESNLMLSDDKSPWGADIFLEVSKAVPGATNDTLSGTFLTKVFEGPFRDAGTWAREMTAYVANKGRALQRLYFGYTTCPRCAKAYGKNYVVLFAKVDEAEPGNHPSA
ncbi:MAG: hypothetical protein IPQ07_38710 [Myxococcales bacterium]|nr:hypothetical protein [Myxococcales bacterium]